MFSATHRATDPVIVTVEPNGDEQSSDVLQQLSDLLDKAIDARRLGLSAAEVRVDGGRGLIRVARAALRRSH